MKANKFKQEEKLIQEGVAVLMDSLGPVETNRFLNLTVKNRTESVKRHRAWQKTLKKEAFFKETLGK